MLFVILVILFFILIFLFCLLLCILLFRYLLHKNFCHNNLLFLCFLGVLCFHIIEWSILLLRIFLQFHVFLVHLDMYSLLILFFVFCFFIYFFWYTMCSDYCCSFCFFYFVNKFYSFFFSSSTTVLLCTISLNSIYCLLCFLLIFFASFYCSVYSIAKSSCFSYYYFHFLYLPFIFSFNINVVGKFEFFQPLSFYITFLIILVLYFPFCIFRQLVWILLKCFLVFLRFVLNL